MSRPLPLVTLALGTMLALSWGATPALADFNTSVQVTVQREVSGLFLYTYTVSDLANSTSNIGEFDLFVGPDANLRTILGPTGFLNDYTPGNSTIAFQSTDSSTDIAPNLSGKFSFETLRGPGLANDRVASFDGPQNLGVILAPTAVPEPASLALLGLGLAGMVAGRQCRNRKHAE